MRAINPLVVTYTYDDSGLRTSKTVGGAKTEYYWNGSRLVGQKQGSSVLQFLYDGSGQLYGFLHNGTPYYYVYNGQGDVVRVLDQYGETEVIYTYDAWGKQLSQKDTAGSSIPSYAASDIANINPIRYRGYYYDIESGFYYLQSRYYDPTTGRFINGDGQINNDMLGSNLFAYCGNYPVNCVDPTGRAYNPNLGTNDEPTYCYVPGCPGGDQCIHTHNVTRKWYLDRALKLPNSYSEIFNNPVPGSRLDCTFNCGCEVHNGRHNGYDYNRVPRGTPITEMLRRHQTL